MPLLQSGSGKLEDIEGKFAASPAASRIALPDGTDLLKTSADINVTVASTLLRSSTVSRLTRIQYHLNAIKE
jgi:hypothetical protein